MKISTEEVVVSEIVKTTKTVEKITCSDGRKFEMHEAERAEKYEKRWLETEEFKKKINYHSCDIELLPGNCYSYGSHSYSFTFDWSAEFTKQDNLLDRLTSMAISDAVLNGETGKFIVIQYYEIGDYGEDYSGYFGLLSDYIKELEDAVNAAKALL